jgi:hypothetical protein
MKRNTHMSTSDEKLKLLKEELQRARAVQDSQRNLRKKEIDAAKQSRGEAAQERHEGMMSQLRAMRALLSEQCESQAQQREQMEQRHAEEVQLHENMHKQTSDILAAVASLRDERRADWEQRAEEQARMKAGG